MLGIAERTLCQRRKPVIFIPGKAPAQYKTHYHYNNTDKKKKNVQQIQLSKKYLYNQKRTAKEQELGALDDEIAAVKAEGCIRYNKRIRYLQSLQTADTAKLETTEVESGANEKAELTAEDLEFTQQFAEYMRNNIVQGKNSANTVSYK